jgi:Peptidase M15
MRAAFEVSPGLACCSAHRSRRRSVLALLPATAAAFALHAAPAAARPTDMRWQGPEARLQYVERDDDDDDDRPRRRQARKHTSTSHGTFRQPRATQRTRARSIRRVASIGPARRPANARTAIPARAPERIALEQRSVVAAHPLLPEAPLAGQASVFDPGPQVAAPRCRSAQPGTLALAVASFGRAFNSAEPALVEGAWPHCRGARNPRSDWQLASLGPVLPAPHPSALPSLSGGSIRWIASAGCLAAPLRAVLAQVAANFGPLTVNSTCRSRTHNRRVGGAPRSYHLTGNAVDFRVRGSYGAVLRYLARLRTVGGLKHYGSGVFHIDTGPRRTCGTRRRVRYARRW